MPVTLAMLKSGYTLGGELSEIPKPYIFKYPNDYEPRPIRIHIMVWKKGSSIGASGHYHVDIKEANNEFWNADTVCWQTPWNREKDRGIYDAIEGLKGRSNMYTESTKPEEVCEWITKILQEWKVDSSTHKLEWDIRGTDDDDEDNQLINNVRLPLKRDEDHEIPICPKCGNRNVTFCPGSTNQVPVPGINWICSDCLYEW